MLNNSDEWRPGDDLDRALDAALAQYAAVEPRPGLEERIRANLRSADASTGAQAWWNWRVAAALAAVLVIAASLAWRWNKASHRPVVLHGPEVQQAPIAPYQASGETVIATQRKALRHRLTNPPSQPQVAAVEPKLDVFPSPLPLSEQERILALYVEKYPQHAALIAEARMEALRQQAEERRRMSSEQDEKQ